MADLIGVAAAGPGTANAPAGGADAGGLAMVRGARHFRAVVRRNGIGFEPGVWFFELGRKADAGAFPTAVMASW